MTRKTRAARWKAPWDLMPRDNHDREVQTGSGCPKHARLSVWRTDDKAAHRESNAVIEELVELRGARLPLHCLADATSPVTLEDLRMADRA